MTQYITVEETGGVKLSVAQFLIVLNNKNFELDIRLMLEITTFPLSIYLSMYI